VRDRNLRNIGDVRESDGQIAGMTHRAYDIQNIISTANR
jgi:hypothetical protein